MLTTLELLLVAFLIHVLWWRIHMPKNTSLVLLVFFFSFMLISLAFFHFIEHEAVSTKFKEVQFIMLYMSYALVYIILYSAIEQQSPTLAIVHYIHLCDSDGCDSLSLYEVLSANNQITNRLALIERSGWIMKNSRGNLCLLAKGKQVAGVFNLASLIFGLKKGG